MAKKFYLNIDDTMEDFFHEMESIQDGKEGHTLMFEGATKQEAAQNIGERLQNFFEERMRDER